MTKELHKENFNRNQIAQLVKMTEEEWRETLRSLCDNGEFDKMWQLAQKAPPVWSRELLQKLGKVKWTPSQEGEREVFQKLLSLAENCVEEVPLGGLVSCKKVLRGHSWSVYSLAISPDGKILASGNWNSTVRLWRLPDGKRLGTLEGHSSWVRCLAISPDGKILASGSSDKTVRLWGLPDGQHLHTLEGHYWGVFCLAISPDGKILASGSSDKTVRLWGLPNGKHLRTLEGHSSWVRCLAISPDGKILASGSSDKTVRLWRLPDGEHLCTLEGHYWGVWSLAISPDGKILASGSRDKTVRLWGLQLPRVTALPLEQLTPEDIKLVEGALSNKKITEDERHWLEFILELIRWEQRFDIEIDFDDPESIEDPVEFDIEIEG